MDYTLQLATNIAKFTKQYQSIRYYQILSVYIQSYWNYFEILSMITKKQDDFNFTSDFCLKSLIGISCVCSVLEIALGNSFF